MSFAGVTPHDAKRLIHAGEEVAFLDVREAWAFGDGHPLFAVHCPYSRLELMTLALVPRAHVPVLLIDGGDGIAERAARRLAACGYTDVRVILGGVPAWAGADLGVFAGVNVPSKALGELLEHAHHPDTIDAGTLNSWRSAGRHFHFFDARPPSEYGRMRIPGAQCLPNGELAHRLAAVIEDEATPIVITCAGRTRGIVGALGLRAAGIRNPVFALENGTQGWALAGFHLDRGAKADPFPLLAEAGRSASRARARKLADHGVPFIVPEHASDLLHDGAHTTYLFDLRTADERAARPCPGATPVLAGQIVQATDQYVGVRHSRLVLVDDTGLRGALAALWLAALGFDVHVVALDEHGGIPDASNVRLVLPPMPPRISAAEALLHAERDDATVIDVRTSAEWEEAHLLGSRWAIRPSLVDDLPAGISSALLYGEEPMVAAAALDLGDAEITARWLDADLEDCAKAGWQLAGGAIDRNRAVDRVWFVHDRHDGNREASLQYLAWEMGLIGQLDADERAEFRAVALPA